METDTTKGVAGSNSLDDLFKFDEGSQSKSLKLLGIQLRPLYLCGILPPPSCSKSRCKLVLYNIFTTVILIWFPFHIGAQFMAMYEHRQQLTVVTGLVFQVSLYICTYLLSLYSVFNRKSLTRLLNLVETKFIPELENIILINKHKPIIKGAFHHTTVLIWVLLIEQWIVLFAWMCLPIMVRYYDILNASEQIVDESLDSRDHYLKYFGMVLWLPPNVDKFPIYELVYIFNAVGTYAVASNFQAVSISFLMFIFNTTTHFKILTASMESLDEIFEESLKIRKNTEEHKQTNLNVSILSLFEEQIKSQSLDISEQITDAIQESHYDDDDDKNQKNIKTEIGSEQQLQLPLIVPESYEKVYQYLINCIKYHQVLLEYCDEIVDFLSTPLLIFFLGIEVMVCFTAFQLALGLNDGKFKFFTSFVATLVWPLMICWYGENLTQQSLAVKYAAFNCQWYNYSKRFKKLLQFVIMRADRPVQFNAGKFYAVSLETFADIGNKVYAFYTVLKNMLDTST